MFAPMSDFLTSKENIVIDLLFEWLGESRFNRTLSEYKAVATRVPKLESVVAHVNQRLDEMAEARDAPYEICYFKMGDKYFWLSFPKIISARSDDAVDPRRAQQRRYQSVGLLDAVAHPCAVIDACAIHYSRWRTSSEFASGAPRQRSASHPGTRGAQCRSGVPHTRFARAI